MERSGTGPFEGPPTIKPLAGEYLELIRK
jgi:hypothetical protein